MKRATKKKLKIMKDNYSWIIAIFTGLSIIVANVLKFIEYLTGVFYFSFYEIDSNLYKYSDTGFIYGLVVSLIFILALISLLYCFYQRISNAEKSNFNKIINILIIMTSNSYITFIILSELKLLDFFICFALLILVEYICIKIFLNKSDKKIKKDNFSCNDIIDFVKILPFVFIILMLFSGAQTIIRLQTRNYYRVIEDNKVIVYSNNDYYLTLDCKIQEDYIIIYKGTQNKIDTFNVYSKYTKFSRVEFK